MARRISNMGGKAGGLQDMINSVTAENSFADPRTLDAIVYYIQSKPDRGSDKALKYLKNRFTQKNVKVQNSSLIVFETCQKRCGHIFRERAPHSELFMELMKVATLKRKADVQIYNKVLALIEDWAEAIDVPGYRAAHEQLKVQSVRFPNRTVRDLSEYREGASANPYGQAQAAPPYGVHTAGGYEVPGSPPASGAGAASPGGSRTSTPYAAYSGNGHFAPKFAPESANVASLPDNMLSAGQPKLKLQEDLNAAQNSVNLLVEMLAPITISNPGDVKQEYVAELAQKCEMMLPQLAHLAEAGDVTDEKNLNQTLVVHAEMEESLAKYHRLLDAANGKPATEQATPAPSAAKVPVVAAPFTKAAPQPAQPTPPPPKKEVNLLDWDDEPAAPVGGAPAPVPAAPAVAAATAAAASSAATVGAVAASSPPAPKAPAQPAEPPPSAFDSIMSLFDAPQQTLQPPPGAAPQYAPSGSGGFGQPNFGPSPGQPNFGAPSGQSNFGPPGGPPNFGPPSGQPNFGPPSVGSNAPGGFGQPNFGPPSVGSNMGSGGFGSGGFGGLPPPGAGAYGFGPPSFQPQQQQLLQLQGPPGVPPSGNYGWSGSVPQVQPPQANPFGGAGGPPTGAPSAPAPAPSGGASSFASFDGPPAFGAKPPGSSVSAAGSAPGSPAASAKGAPPSKQGSGSVGAPSGAPDFGAAAPLQQQQATPNFGQAPPPPQQQQPQQQQQQPNFGQAPPPSSQQGPPDFGAPSQFGGAPPSFSQGFDDFTQPPQQQQQQQQQQYGSGSFGPPSAGPQGFGGFGDAPAFGNGPPPPQQQQYSAPPQFGGPPPNFGGQPNFGAPPQFQGGFNGPPVGAPYHAQQAALPPPQFPPKTAGTSPSGFAPKPSGLGPSSQSGSPSGNHGSGLIAAVRSNGSPSGSMRSTANPFDDPEEPSAPKPASKLVPGHVAAGGAGPKPSWLPKVADADDPFSSIGPSFKPKA